MYEVFEQINVNLMPLDEFRTLVNDKNVYLMYNDYLELSISSVKLGLKKPDIRECWRLKPLSLICSNEEELTSFYNYYINGMHASYQCIVRINPGW